MSSCDSCFGTLQMPLAADVLSWLSDSLAEPGEGLSCASSKDMTAVNASHTTNGLHELVSGSGGGSGAGGGGGQTGGGAAALRLPLVAPAAGGGSGGTGAHHAHAVFMYSTAADGNVTLQLRDACGVGDDCSGGGGPGSDDGVTTLSISYQDIATDLLGDAAATIDVLLGAATPSAACTATLHAATGSDVDVSPDGADAASSVLDLFDSSSGGRDLTLSPQTFTSSAEAFISDNSDSLGVPPDAPAVCGSDELKKSVGVVTSGDAVKLTVKRARPKVASPNRQGPQQCQVCSKVFGNASALAKHKLTHSDERKYVCSMCGKAFKRQDHLNGHMLTHRNKKPYECKAAGCGKSYCDARSLRRHTENHHSGISSSSSSSSGPGSASGGGGVTTLTPGAASAAAAGGGAGAAVLASGGGAPLVTTSTLSPAQGAASGDAASPHGAASSTCIQYAPAPTGSGSAPASPAQGPRSYETPSTTTSRSTVAGKSQLQQLLASEPAKSSNNTPNNDGLTKQQLELIHQIMEQTQRQSQQITAATNKANAALNGGGSSRTQPVATTNKPKLSRTWSAPAPTTSNATVKSTTSLSSGGNNAGQQSSTSKHPHQNVATAVATPAPKPVECNLCHRKFKNIPALNGHMRLHGGYFKKDADNKKCEKKESSGPPLQTASVSVRALIEEKIISKRTTTTTTSTTTSHPQTSNGGGERQQVVAPPLHPLERTSPKVTSFVVPAPPNHVVVTTASDKQSWLLNDKSRRHSDADKFTMPRNPINTTTVTQQEADVLADLILKRTNTKIVKRTASDPGVTSQQQQLQIQFQEASDSFALAYDGANYFSDDQDTMLLQNIDAAQLAASLLPQDQQLQDIASLEEYASSLQESVDSPSFSHTVNHELQAVLDSPLPESLAEFSTYHPSDSKDVLESFSQRQQRYTDSPTIGRNSSPLMRHDSPGCFAYPTPPASHEGPSSGYGTSHLLPLITDTSSGARDIDEPPQASSPLSAAFYTSTMSSAAAVEEALEEVLPGESIAPDDMYPSLTNSPPPGPQSPLSVSSPGPPISPHYTLQSQMMPNSEDPLLSSSPKEFATRKKFEFQSFKIVSGSGLVELASPTTLIVDSNGELKFIQTGGTKNIVVTSTGVLNGHQTLQVVDTSVNSTSHSVTNLRTDNSGSMSSLTAALGTGLESMRTVGLGTSLGIKSQVHPPQHRALQRIAGGTNIIGRGTTRNVTQPIQRSRLHIAVDNLKSEESDDVFLSPTMIPASPIRVSRKRPRSEPPLAVPVVHQSRLRAARGRPPGAAPYTPAPMLNPSRTGPGLYAHAKWKATSVSQNHLHGHGHVHGHHHIHGRRSPDSTPESDSTPHINVGPQYQCSVPSVPCGMTPLETDQDREPTYEHLLWDPGIGGVCTDTEIEMYLEFACCAAVPGGGRNKEYALHLLHLCAGNIHEAMLRLMQPTPSLPPDHPMLAYQYCESDRWGPQESEAFHRAVLKHGKDFYNVAKEIGTKTVKQCVQFYYVWKKVCSEEYRRIRGSRGARDTPPFADIMEADMKLLGVLDTEPLLTPTPPELPRTFTCEYADCSASFNSRAALNGHIRIHGGTVRRSPTPSNMPGNSSTQISHHHHHLQPQTQDEEFPCKVCGKVFSKIKSRSAHMKSHRPPDAEPRRVSKSSMVSDAPSPGHGYDTSSPIPSLNTAPSPHHGH